LTHKSQSNAEWSSNRTPANYFFSVRMPAILFWVYLYAAPFNFGHFLAHNMPVRPFTEALLTLAKIQI